MFFRQHPAQLVGCCLYFSITAVGCKADASGESGYAALCFGMQEALEHSFVHFAERALFDVKKSAQMDGLQKKRRKFSNTH
ncbi:hypothetical protein [Ruminococcus champanellensis]|uniref:hypothetical protein n=1 Tax=Ruminococcus champanellensis TaxID=1161942 RepID=UPI002E784CD7|nr:hypothetical protein [Ruminococcus champanellensis]